MTKIFDKIFLVAILGLVVAIFVNNTLYTFSDLPSTEKRGLSVCPIYTKKNDDSIKAYIKNMILYYPQDYDQCYKDNFSFRNYVIGNLNYFRLKFLHESPTPNIVEGKDGYYFYNDDNFVEAYNGSKPFSSQQLDDWNNSFQEQSDYLKAKNIQYITAIIPNKLTMYSEYLPDKYATKFGISNLEAFTKYANEHPKSYKRIDLKDYLTKLKQDQKIWEKTESHWNNVAAINVYQKFMSQLDISNLKVKTRSLNNYNLNFVDGAGDLSYYMGLKYFIEDKNVVEYKPNFSDTGQKITQGVHYVDSGCGSSEEYEYKNDSNPNLGTLVIFGDSYTDAIRPYFADSFSKVYYLKCVEKFDAKYIEKYNPQVVIQLFNESNFGPAQPIN